MTKRGIAMTRRDFLKGAAATSVVFAVPPASSYRENAKPGENSRFAKVARLAGLIFVNDAPGRRNQELLPGDLVRAEKKARAWILLKDKVIVMVKPNSSFTIGRANSAKDDLPEKEISLSLAAGAVLNYVHGTREKPVPFSVRTPVAVAGVRGTTFFVKVVNEKRAYVCDCWGDVELTPAAMPEAPPKLVSADHHTAFFIEEKGVLPEDCFTPAGLLDHTDEEIAEMKRIFREETGVSPFEEKQNPPPEESDEGYPG